METSFDAPWSPCKEKTKTKKIKTALAKDQTQETKTSTPIRTA